MTMMKPTGRVLTVFASCLCLSQAFVIPRALRKPTIGSSSCEWTGGKILPSTIGSAAAAAAAAAATDGEEDNDPPQSSSSSSSSSLSSVASTKKSGAGSGSSSSSFQLTKTSSTSKNRWDNFDYNQQWYPVSWDVDLPTNQPTKVTLLDVDYVIARDSNGKYTALEDRCPHKAAALSEGRLTDTGLFQCAYHGWSFNGANGDCVQIPQSAATGSTPPKKACAKAVPILEHQQMIWLWPGPTPPADGVLPPTIPEMDQEGWKVIKVVRDFPQVDWPLLMSNILDPDHGCFAHTALAFDMYSASAEHPLDVQEQFDGPNWGFTSQVQAVDKLLQVDQEKRAKLGLKTKKVKTQPAMRTQRTLPDQQPEEIQATSQLFAPTTATLCRRDAKGETKFITAFWVTPVGTGKSRFMSAAVSNSFPFQIPRWIFQINLNRFLDQDTLLVATQQPPLLRAEAQGADKPPRSSLFAYGSPTDKAVRLLDNFWDSTLHKVPNRQRTLQQLYNSGQLNQCASREVVLDRNSQHLQICPDSQGFVRNCQRITQIGTAIAGMFIIKALWQRAMPKKFRWLPILSAFVAWVANQLRQQFSFVKTEDSRNKDLKQIPIKAWLDP